MIILESSGYMELTFLTVKQIFEMSGVVSQICEAIDYAKLQNYSVSSCSWWTKNISPIVGYIYIVDVDKDRLFSSHLPEDYSIGIRFVLNQCNIDKLDINDKKIEFGSFPQNAVSKDVQKELENLYQNNKLIKTNKTYINADNTYNNEFIFNNKKYVRVFNKYGNGNSDYVWIEVSPIKWTYYKKDNILIADDLLYTGIPFNDIYKNGGKDNSDFKNTSIYKFMNTYLIKDMFDNVSINNEKDASKEFVSIDNKIKTLRKRIDNITK